MCLAKVEIVDTSGGLVIVLVNLNGLAGLPEGLGGLLSLTEQCRGNSPMAAAALRPVWNTALETGDRLVVSLLFQKHLSQFVLVERDAVTIVFLYGTLPKARLRFLHPAQFKECPPAEIEVRWVCRSL